MRNFYSIKGTLFFGLLVFCISCKNDGDKKQPTTKEKTIVTFNATAQKLVGKWRNNEDSLSTITYTQTHRIGSYANTIVRSDLYKLSASCNDDELSEDAFKGIYVLESNGCWSINTLNKNHLELTSMSRGNTLSYTKIE